MSNHATNHANHARAITPRVSASRNQSRTITHPRNPRFRGSEQSRTNHAPLPAGTNHAPLPAITHPPEIQGKSNHATNHANHAPGAITHGPLFNRGRVCSDAPRRPGANQ